MRVLEVKRRKMIGEKEALDHISCLPDEILVFILSLLPLRDAARTTTLSKSWRSLFHSVPCLVFDESSINRTDNEDLLLDMIDDVLIARGFRNIFRCEINCDLFVDNDDFFDDIIERICSNGIKELILRNTARDACLLSSSSICSCRSLVKLEIENCYLDVPDNFEGLRCLKSLDLDSVWLTDCELQNLLRCCGALQRLRVSYCDLLRNVNICSQNLEFLEIVTFTLLAISVKDACLLRDVSIGFFYGEDFLDHEDLIVRERTRLVRLFMELGHVEFLRLDFGDEFGEVLEQMPERLPQGFLLVNLSKLILIFQVPNAMYDALLSCLLNSCPNLKELGVEAKEFGDMDEPTDFVSGYWKRQKPAHCVHSHLKHAWLYRVNDYLEQGIDFASFLLVNAKVLEKMTVTYQGVENALELEMLLLIQPWASPNAKLEFKTSIVALSDYE